MSGMWDGGLDISRSKGPKGPQREAAAGDWSIGPEHVFNEIEKIPKTIQEYTVRAWTPRLCVSNACWALFPILPWSRNEAMLSTRRHGSMLNVLMAQWPNDSQEATKCLHASRRQVPSLREGREGQRERPTAERGVWRV